MATSDWRHKDLWKREGKNFLVEISRLSRPGTEPTENLWCIYAYVYPEHPLFAKFDPNGGLHGQPGLPLHGGCSYFRAHYKADNEITSFQIGCDYDHYGDGYYLTCDAQDGGSIFYDAEELYAELAAMEAP